MRQIRFEASFDEAVKRLGGYEVIDEVLEAIIDGLIYNPYGFPVLDNDWMHIRYAVTRPVTIGDRRVPALVFTFSILPNRDVSMINVEEHEPY
jgi:hypothetical protein